MLFYSIYANIYLIYPCIHSDFYKVKDRREVPQITTTSTETPVDKRDLWIEIKNEVDIKYTLPFKDESTGANPELLYVRSADELLSALYLAFNRMTGTIEQMLEMLSYIRALRHIIATTN